MKEKICGIYCIENILNHKKYIGMSRDIYRRWIEHISELKNNVHNNQYLQYSWNKYGEKAFEFYIIEICEERLLSDRERWNIKHYNTLSHANGYNLTVGGENTSIGKIIISLQNGAIYTLMKEVLDLEKITYPTLEIWCNSRFKYMYYDEYLQLSTEEQVKLKYVDYDQEKHEKLSKIHSRENLSEETIKKLSLATTGANNPRAFKVYCPQLDETFDCAKYASDKYDICHTSIGQCIKGKLKSAGIHPITGEKLTWERVG